MTNEEIIESIRAQYNRDLRKQLVKRLLESEKMNDRQGIQSGYNIMNQIFSYVLKERGWTIAENANRWDNSPLEILQQAFPNIESTQWYKSLELNVQKSIEVQMSEETK